MAARGPYLPRGRTAPKVCRIPRDVPFDLQDFTRASVPSRARRDTAVIVYKWLAEYLALTGSGSLGSMWQCPAHEDSDPSLTVKENPNGRVLVHCHAGCSYFDVVDALSLPRWIWRMVPGKTPAEWLAQADHVPRYPKMVASPGSRAVDCQTISVEHHVYVADQIRLERRRYSDGRKQLRWERRLGSDWVYMRGDIRLTDLPLYRLSYIKQASALAEPIVLCESESSVDALIDAGVYATTWAGGAANPNLDRLQRGLAGMTVVWIPDNDPAGCRASELVVRALREVCCLRVLWPHEGHDARDLLESLGAELMAEGLRSLIVGPVDSGALGPQRAPEVAFGEAG